MESAEDTPRVSTNKAAEGASQMDSRVNHNIKGPIQEQMLPYPASNSDLLGKKRLPSPQLDELTNDANDRSPKQSEASPPLSDDSTSASTKGRTDYLSSSAVPFIDTSEQGLMRVRREGGMKLEIAGDGALNRSPMAHRSERGLSEASSSVMTVETSSVVEGYSLSLLQRLKDENDLLRRESERQIRELTSKMRELEMQLAMSRQREREMTAENASLRLESEKQRAQLHELERKVREAVDKYKVVKRQRQDELDRREGSVALLTTKTEEIEKKVAERDATIEELRMTMAQLEADYEHVEVERDEVIASAQEQAARIQGLWQDMRNKAQAALGALRQENNTLKEENYLLQRELGLSRQQLEEVQSQLLNLQTQQTEKLLHSQKAKEQAMEIKQRDKKVEQQLKVLERERTSLRERLFLLLKDHAVLKEKLHAANRERESLRISLDRFKAKYRRQRQRAKEGIESTEASNELVRALERYFAESERPNKQKHRMYGKEATEEAVEEQPRVDRQQKQEEKNSLQVFSQLKTRTKDLLAETDKQITAALKEDSVLGDLESHLDSVLRDCRKKLRPKHWEIGTQARNFIDKESSFSIQVHSQQERLEA